MKQTTSAQRHSFMGKQHKKNKGSQPAYIISAMIFSISATAIALAPHDLWAIYPAIEAVTLTILFLSAFLISHQIHKNLQKKVSHQPTTQKEIDKLIDLSAQLKNRLEIEKQNSLIDIIYDAAFALKKETEAPAGQSGDLHKSLSCCTKKQSIAANPIAADKELKDTRIIFMTSDASDRHQIITHLTGWQVQVKACSNAARTFTEILSASDSNAPYDMVIVDQRQLDMEPAQFAKSVYSEGSLQNLSLIYLGPENTPDRDQQLSAAGYSHILQTPINKSLLYNALHAATNTTHQHFSQNVTSFINHYTREQSTLPPLDILIAANPANLKRIKHIFKTTKHQVFAVENGEHALNALDSHNFDIAIFELEMPIMTGAEAIKLYRFTHQNAPWTPFILLAPESNSQIINECSDLDIDACLIGKFEQHTLLATIKQAISEPDKEQQLTSSGKSIIAENPSQAGSNQHNSAILGQATLRDLEELGSGQEFVRNLINSFLYNSEELLHGMEKAIAENNYPLFIDHAFAFKDSAGSLGALAVYKASIKASHLEQANFKEHADARRNEIKISFNKTRQALLDYIAEQNNAMHNR